ncbi:MAG: hypothetical protein F6J87_28110 [Spirulina sp. SIO3F2]|nr:hypothetical protein [Spirulina sp. SIO3F2]
MTVKARRTEIQLGHHIVEGFMLPDGSYRISQTQAAQCIGRSELSTRHFLESKSVYKLLGERYRVVSLEIETDYLGHSRFNTLPLEVVTAYWILECSKGNTVAMHLIMEMTSETLEHRFDIAFGVENSESEPNNRLQRRREVWELELEEQGDVFEVNNLLRQEKDISAGVLPQESSSSDDDLLASLIGTLHLGTTDLAENHDHYLAEAMELELNSGE